MAMPHRSRHSIRSAIQKLFSRKKLTPVSSEATQPDLQEQEVRMAALEQAYAAPPAPQAPAGRQQCQASSDAARATLEQQWQKQSALIQLDQWTNVEMAHFLKEVQQISKKGQSILEASQILERLQFFPMGAQGYEALADQPSGIINKGSKEFGGRPGFIMLIRGPEQFVTKGPGYIYLYHDKDAPLEFKVGMCEDLPERRLGCGKLVGRVVDQRKRNKKEYVLLESFPVPHRKLVDEVLKLRLKQWNFHHPDRGDGYTEWYRKVVMDDLKDHIRDVARVTTALYT